jgi:glutamine cyclotransferase
MRKYNTLTFILLATLLVISCKDDNSSESFFKLNEDVLKAQYIPKESIQLEVLNPQNKKIDSIVYSINDKIVGTIKGANKLLFDCKDQKLGYQNLKANIYFEGEKEVDSSRVELISDITPKVLSYTIVNTYPHDHQAYTEGLEFYKDTLYEATGNGAGNDTGIKGVSSMRKVDYKTGKIFKKVEYSEEIFGEGISILNGKIYQLTYKQNECYVYDVNTFKKLKTLPYYKPMEGWGMTNDGKNLYYDDGSEKIHIVNPENIQQIDYLNVYSGNSKIPAINELEWVDGKIYSNIYTKNFIIVINPKNGAVEALLDLSDLEKKRTKLADVDYLNGIAYNPKTKTFFVTGKNWDKMFEIKINQ